MTEWEFRPPKIDRSVVKNSDDLIEALKYTHSGSIFQKKMDIINNTSTVIVATDESGIPMKVSPSYRNECSLLNKEYDNSVIVRVNYHVPFARIEEFRQWYSCAANITTAVKSEMSRQVERFNTIQSQQFTHQDLDIYIVYVIDIKQIHQEPSGFYDKNTNLLLRCYHSGMSHEQGINGHPLSDVRDMLISEHFMNMLGGGEEIKKASMGFHVSVVDNTGLLPRRYLRVGNQVLMVRPYKDHTRKDGVYLHFTQAETEAYNEGRFFPCYAPIDAYNEKSGFYLDRDDAAGLNAKQEADREINRLRMERERQAQDAKDREAKAKEEQEKSWWYKTRSVIKDVAESMKAIAAIAVTCFAGYKALMSYIDKDKNLSPG